MKRESELKIAFQSSRKKSFFACFFSAFTHCTKTQFSSPKTLFFTQNLNFCIGKLDSKSKFDFMVQKRGTLHNVHRSQSRPQSLFRLFSSEGCTSLSFRGTLINYSVESGVAVVDIWALFAKMERFAFTSPENLRVLSVRAAMTSYPKRGPGWPGS